MAPWTPEAASRKKGFELQTDTEKLADTLQAVKDYHKPHVHEIADKAKKTNVAIGVIISATVASILLITLSADKCDEKKLGMGLLLACATGVGGFLTGGSLKP